MPDPALENPAPTTTPAATGATAEEQPVRLAHAGPTPSHVHPTLLHSGMNSSRFFRMHTMGAIFPIVAGLLLYGWRGALVLLTVIAATAAGVALWRRVGSRGRHLGFAHAIWLAALLGLMLPAHLMTFTPLWADAWTLWPLAPAAGLTLATAIWLLGGIGSGRIHPLLVTYLLLALFFQQDLLAWRVLQRSRVVIGDVARATQGDASELAKEPWITGRARLPEHDALLREPLAPRLVNFTSGIERPLRSWISLEAMLRDQMPPLEDLIVGGQPGPIGLSSGIAVIIGGLFLLYRGLIDFRIPLLIFLAAYATLLILPVPVVITEAGPVWRWIAMREHGVEWPTAITFANYQIMAGPLLFMAFFLASAPAVRPMARRARAIYALLVGLLAAASQLYISVALGPYIALLVIGLLTPALDRWFRPRALV